MVELIGWRTVTADQLAPEGVMGARSSYRQAILEPELRSALATLNPAATPSMIDAAVREVLAAPSQDIVENNRAFHKLLASGVPVQINEHGETRTIGLRLLDRETPRANRFLVANQVIIEGDAGTVRADVVVFVNGLPCWSSRARPTPPPRSSARTPNCAITVNACRTCSAPTRCW